MYAQSEAVEVKVIRAKTSKQTKQTRIIFEQVDLAINSDSVNCTTVRVSILFRLQ
jgi:hypothetical protein